MFEILLSFPLSLFFLPCLIFGSVSGVLLIKKFVEIYVLYNSLKKSNLKKFTAAGSWAVVTGASDGIGAEFCRQLSEAGLGVVLISRTESRLQAVADSISGLTKVVVCDFDNAGDAEYDYVASQLSGLDIAVLVNNVGASHKVAEKFLDIDEKNLMTMINLNITATTQMIKIVLPTMVQQKRGLIVNISSEASQFPLPMHSVYSASKEYVNYLSTALSYEYAADGIFVECICPSYIKTKLSGIQRVTKDRPDPATFVKSVISQIGTKKMHTGFSYHEQSAFIKSLIPDFIRIPQAMKILTGARKKWLARQENKA